jgi:hypothetical protein
LRLNRAATLITALEANVKKCHLRLPAEEILSVNLFDPKIPKSVTVDYSLPGARRYVATMLCYPSARIHRPAFQNSKTLPFKVHEITMID